MNKLLLAVGVASWLGSALAGGPGFPSRDAKLDALPGFKNPPPGYGEVPFWWWTGDDLNVDRMIGQIRELHKKGISGVQVNYSHYDTPGSLTEQGNPKIFSDEWWSVYSKISAECAKLNMGIGLSTYTLDWPDGATNLFYKLFYHRAEWNAIQLEAGERKRVHAGETATLSCNTNQFATRAYRIINGELHQGGVDLLPFLKAGTITWTAPEGEWEVWTFNAVRQAGTLNPLMPGAGQTVINGYFQKFQDHNPGKSSKGLNYFFNDELTIGVGKFAWNPDFAAEFRKRKGYDLLELLPAMWTEMGSLTPKVRMDYADVRMSLMEERYFKPIFDWHNSRQIIFGCDPGSRGLRPNEFGDYFRAIRWYTAPGHDTPNGRANLIKGKVSSSISNLYQRQRVWLEGYHSLGWGAAPELLMFATRENYLYGCTLLNLHGLYYTTYGSYWEWAPPDHHFRMPYWAHMDQFLRYFERLSYLLSQGHFIADVAVVYPVAPFEAEMDGNKDGERATKTAFELGAKLMAAGINFEFIDNDSLKRATIENGRLVLKEAGAAYQALVFADMNAVRWPSIQKAAAFAQAGGNVYSVGLLPIASDRAGRDDIELTAMNQRAFKPANRLTDTASAVEAIRTAFAQDVRSVNQTVRALHRKVGPRDIYMVMDATPDSVVEFRAKGAVELWDPWTGKNSPLRVMSETANGTQVQLPLQTNEAQVVVFTPGKKHINPPPLEERTERVKTLPDAWNVSFVPTMDNTHGDFRLPVTAENKLIGLEARRFAWATETEALAKTAMLPATDDHGWSKKLHGFGTQFYVLGPIPTDVDVAQLDAELAKLKVVDPAAPFTFATHSFTWQPYDFSWRYGKEGDSGHQGYHGLKRTVTDDFLCLGKRVGGLNESRYVDDDGGSRYYLWTSATVVQPTKANILVSRTAPGDASHTSPILTPAAVFVNGAVVSDLSQPVALQVGANPLLVRYDHGGRGHFVLRQENIARPSLRQPLSMTWTGDGGLIPFDVSAGQQPAEWFRFLSAPGTTAIRVQARGQVEAWLDGQPMTAADQGRFVAKQPAATASVVALRVKPQTGYSGGGVLPEPVTIETDGKGLMPLGDWSQLGILTNYSGGVRYSTQITLTKEEASAKAVLDLGRVIATVEVHVNGKKVGVRVAPPWRVDVTGFLKRGENTVDVLVYNTLANHYQTSPSPYRGKPISGLLGPVRLLSQEQ